MKRGQPEAGSLNGWWTATEIKWARFNRDCNRLGGTPVAGFSSTMYKHCKTTDKLKDGNNHFSFNHKTVFLIIYSWQSHVGPEADVLGLNKLWVVNKISLKLQVSQLKKKVFPQQAMWARSSVPCGRRPTPPSCRWRRRGGLQTPCQPALHTWSW